MAEPRALVARERDLAARAKREEQLKQARKDQIIRSGGQVAETYRPQTVVGGVYDAAERGLAGLNRLFGVPERDAAQRGSSAINNLKVLTEGLIGAEELEGAGRRVASGKGSTGDAALLALSVAPIPKPVRSLAAKAGRGALKLGKKALNTRLGRTLTEARPLVDSADDAVEAAFTVTPGAQRRITNQRPVVQGLPAPEQRLGLPAPGPGLPPLAVKTKGGQWWPNTVIGGTSEGWGRNYSPEYAVNKIIDNQFVGDLAPDEQALRDWFAKAAPRYIKNELGTPEDPLMKLAEQGNLHLADTSPNIWARRSRMSMYDEPIGYFTVPPHESENIPGVDLGELAGGPAMQESQQLLAAAPWLSKAPVTDKLYGLTQGADQQLGFHHMLDEMGNALNPQSGLPPELLLDPKSLQRMGLAQASERVGLINQFRVKQAEQAKLSAVDNPATQTFKEYPDDPRGMRWVELRAPEPSDDLLDEVDRGLVDLAVKEGRTIDPAHMEEVRQSRARRTLEDALKYEGDTMGHCVGGYCDDVASGRSRIFSLRDAKGEPHVTVETAPKEFYDLADEDPELGDLFNTYHYGVDAPDKDLHFEDWVAKNHPDTFNRLAKQDIVQIKGKQNRAPKDDYLPFVQDFVKSGQWSNVGDLGNTGLVKLPDGRYIAQQDFDNVIQSEGLDDMYQGYDFNANGFPRDPRRMNPQDWEQFARHFQGYARGGRALAVKPCSCDKSLAAR